MAWMGILKDLIVQPSCHGQGHLSLDQVAQSLFNLTLNTLRDGASTASLGNLFQSYHPHCKKYFFLMPNLRQPSFNL